MQYKVISHLNQIFSKVERKINNTTSYAKGIHIEMSKAS